MAAKRTRVTSGVLVRAGLWSALAFILNLTWEIAHDASDVLGAMAAGMVWLTLCLNTVEGVHRYRSRASSSALHAADQIMVSR
jgi:hypothetical protein